MSIGQSVETVLQRFVVVFTHEGIGGLLAALILAVAIAILMWTLVRWYLPARVELAKACSIVARGAGGDQHERRAVFAERFEDIDAALAALPRIGPAWREFEETLVRPDGEEDDAFGPSRNVRNVRRPQEFISLRTTRMAGDIVRALPGFIVGFGLFLTFVGLIAALGVASSNLDVAGQSGMKDVLGTLLRTAGAKFYASATALLCSILLGLYQRVLLHGLAGRMHKLTDDLEERLQYDATAHSRIEQLRVMREQKDQLRTLAQDIAFSVGDHMRDALSSSQGELVGTLGAVADKLDRLAERTGSSIATSIGDQVEKALADTMTRMSETLDDLKATLASLPGELHAAAAAMEASAAALTERVADGASEGARRAGDRMEGELGQFLAALRQTAEAIAATGPQVATSAQATMDAAAARFGDAGERIGQSTARAVADLAREGESAATSIAAAVRSLDSACAVLGEASRSIGGDVVRFGQEASGLRESLAAGAAAHREAAGGLAEAASETRAVANQNRALAERAAMSADRLGETGTRLDEGMTAVRAMAAALSERAGSFERTVGEANGRIEAILVTAQTDLSQHVARYDGLDTRFAGAFEAFQTAIADQQGRLGEHVSGIDRAFALAVQDLTAAIEELGDTLGARRATRDEAAE